MPLPGYDEGCGRRVMSLPHFVVLDADSGERIAWVAADRRLSAYDNLARAGVQLATTCRGSTICGLCHVQVVDGARDLPTALADEVELLARRGLSAPEHRLACRVLLPEAREHLVLAARLPRRV